MTIYSAAVKRIAASIYVRDNVYVDGYLPVLLKDGMAIFSWGWPVSYELALKRAGDEVELRNWLRDRTL